MVNISVGGNCKISTDAPCNSCMYQHTNHAYKSDDYQKFPRNLGFMDTVNSICYQVPNYYLLVL